jgi:hypothetical protein
MASIVSAGTTSATALNMSADTTGILQLASNNGTVALTITTSQFVGIGTTAPLGPLQLFTASGDCALRLRNATTGNGSGDGADITMTTGLDLYITNRENGNLRFETNGSERITVNPSGNIGVATSSPVALLDMNRGVFGNRLPSAAGASINFSGGFTTGGVTAVSTMLTVDFNACSFFSCALHIFSIGYSLNGGGSANSAQTAAYDIVNIIRQQGLFVSYNITRVSGPTLASGATNTYTLSGAITSNVFTLTGSSSNAGQCGFTFGGYMVYGGQGSTATNIILTTKDGATNSTWGA